MAGTFRAVFSIGGATIGLPIVFMLVTIYVLVRLIGINSQVISPVPIFPHATENNPNRHSMT